MNRSKRDTDIRPVDYSKTYQHSLAQVTHWGLLAAVCFHAAFAILYWALDYPAATIWFNAIPMLIELGLFGGSHFRLDWRQRYHIYFANILTLMVFVSLLIPALVTGGIASSSILWLAFIPVIAFIMVGIKWGVFWDLVCVFSVISIYIQNEILDVSWTKIPSTNFDRAIDMTLVVLAIGVAVWVSDTAKGRTVAQLEVMRNELHHLAIIDPLTQIYNRRYFFDRARQEIKKIRANLSGCISLVLFDVDHFKQVNDLHGHLVGDQVLIDIVSFCQAHLREDDFIARFGGEEFVIMLPDTTQKDAYLIAERIRQEIASAIIATDCGPVQISISVGVASAYPHTHCSLSELVRNADQALYQSKQEGRNRTIVWPVD